MVLLDLLSRAELQLFPQVDGTRCDELLDCVVQELVKARKTLLNKDIIVKKEYDIRKEGKEGQGREAMDMHTMVMT